MADQEIAPGKMRNLYERMLIDEKTKMPFTVNKQTCVALMYMSQNVPVVDPSAYSGTRLSCYLLSSSGIVKSLGIDSDAAGAFMLYLRAFAKIYAALYICRARPLNLQNAIDVISLLAVLHGHTVDLKCLKDYVVAGTTLPALPALPALTETHQDETPQDDDEAFYTDGADDE